MKQIIQASVTPLNGSLVIVYTYADKSTAKHVYTALKAA